jgi:hypothetical protein
MAFVANRPRPVAERPMRNRGEGMSYYKVEVLRGVMLKECWGLAFAPGLQSLPAPRYVPVRL